MRLLTQKLRSVGEYPPPHQPRLYRPPHSIETLLDQGYLHGKSSDAILPCIEIHCVDEKQCGS